jgi:hypothetical protein
MNTVVATNRNIVHLKLTGLVLVVVALVCLYMYFLTLSVVHVVLRKEVAQEALAVRSDIARLEAEYIEAQHTVSERIAAESTFASTDAKVFVTRSTEPTLVLGTVITP